ncbi:hypothetical protein LG634_36415 [Streptomyces bambusae]|uniref:hypothetical protein n=1 Tax=Streptomyces bambusae TaxID=1550616 RepID=UPI001CFF9988|nr:hypothetical protein [Streptomyces bambusae]MCB5170269.1 hypothetical protein [Streptomyces bambusae]
MPTRILITGFNRWRQRFADRLTTDYGLLRQQPDWAPMERTAYAAVNSPFEPPSLFPPL